MHQCERAVSALLCRTSLFLSSCSAPFWHVVAADRAQASNETSSQQIPVPLTAPTRLTQAAIFPLEVLVLLAQLAVLLAQLAVLLAQLAVLDFQPCWRSCSSPFILMY